MCVRVCWSGFGALVGAIGSVWYLLIYIYIHSLCVCVCVYLFVYVQEMFDSETSSLRSRLAEAEELADATADAALR